MAKFGGAGQNPNALEARARGNRALTEETGRQIQDEQASAQRFQQGLVQAGQMMEQKIQSDRQYDMQKQQMEMQRKQQEMQAAKADLEYDSESGTYKPGAFTQEQRFMDKAERAQAFKLREEEQVRKTTATAADIQQRAQQFEYIKAQDVAQAQMKRRELGVRAVQEQRLLQEMKNKAQIDEREFQVKTAQVEQKMIFDWTKMETDLLNGKANNDMLVEFASRMGGDPELKKSLGRLNQGKGTPDDMARARQMLSKARTASYLKWTAATGREMPIAHDTPEGKLYHANALAKETMMRGLAMGDRFGIWSMQTGPQAKARINRAAAEMTMQMINAGALGNEDL